MTKFVSKTELEKQKPSTSKTHYSGEIYPEIFTHVQKSELHENMPLDVAIIWLGTFRLDSSQFPKVKCPICGKEESIIPYMCGGSMLSGSHTIQFYCLNCHEQFVTNDYIEYFRLIKSYIKEHEFELQSSPKFINCTKINQNF